MSVDRAAEIIEETFQATRQGKRRNDWVTGEEVAADLARAGLLVMSNLQARSAAWVAAHHPGHRDIWRRLAKLTEEVGELNRAVIAKDEHRPGRGDPVQEVAQVALVLMSIADLLGVDLLGVAEAEYQRATS